MIRNTTAWRHSSRQSSSMASRVECLGRDAEVNDPGVVKRTLTDLVDAGHEPTKARSREASLTWDLPISNAASVRRPMRTVLRLGRETH